MQRSERLREAHTLAPITNARLRGLDKCFYPEPCMWGPNRHDIRWNEVARERAAAREQMNRGRFICRKAKAITPPIPSNAEKRQDQTSPTHTQTYLGKWNKSPSRCRTPSHPSPHPTVPVSSRLWSAAACEEFSLICPSCLPSDPPLRAGDALPAGDRREVDLVHRVGAVGAALAGGWRRRTAVVAGARRRVAVVPAHLCSLLCVKRETAQKQRENGKRPEAAK